MILYIFLDKLLKIKSPMARRSLGVIPIFIPIFLISADVFSMLLTGEGKFSDYRFKSNVNTIFFEILMKYAFIQKINLRENKRH